MPDPNQIPGKQAIDQVQHGNSDQVQVTRTIAPIADSQNQVTASFETNAGSGSSAITIGQLIANRYQILGEIARGGMGVVYSARDTKLNRDVAVKMLLDRYSPESNTARRFLEEAQIAGQLQHTGIAPIHDLGMIDDGRPFLAMKLIKGQTLSELLKQKKHDTTFFIDRFIEVVQTIAYAHNKGVIHRDLKPGNIMVGAFGEVQVMDWGLAKTMGQRSSERIAKIDHSTSHSFSLVETDRTPDSATQAGSILGTPAYMPPEQAKGLVEQTNSRADVFALGAILCEILTGKPPYTADSFDEIRAQSIMGLTKPAIERLRTCGADAELVSLAIHCLDPIPENRPADASEVDSVLSDYKTNVANRLKSAEHEQAVAQFRFAELAKRRKIRNVFAGIIVVGIAAFTTYLGIQNKKLVEQRNVSNHLQKVAELAGEESERNSKLAQHRLENAVEAVEQVMVRVAGEKWALRPELQKERREVLEEAVAYFKNLGTEDSQDATVRRQAARANLLAAEAYISLGEYDQCRETVKSALSFYRILQAELPNDSKYVRGEAEAEALLGHCDAINALFASALTHYENVLKLAEQATAIEPDQNDNLILKIDANSSLALFYSFQRQDLSRKYHQAALEIGETLLSKPSPSFKVRLAVATSLTNLGVSEIGTTPDQAKEKFAKAQQQIQLLGVMVPPNSRTAEAFVSTKAGLLLYRGVTLIREKKIDEGIVLAREGIDSIAQILKVQPKSFPFQVQYLQFRIVLADMLLNNERVAEARKLLVAVRQDQDQIAAAQPQLSWIRSLGVMQHSNLLIFNLREKYDPEFEEEGRRLIERDDSSSVMPGLKYNIACLYAQAAKLAPEKDRERFALKSIEILNGLILATTYFNDSSNVRHLDNDTDLDPIRNRTDFKQFLLKTKSKVQ